MNQNIRVQFINEKRENGIIAAANFEVEQVILKEKPLICAQYLYNKDFFPACSHCLKSLEQPRDMLQRLSGCRDIPELPSLGDTPLSHENSRCHSCDVELYCSEDCRRSAWLQYHNLLCQKGLDDANSPLVQLETEWKSFHYPPESATITLMVRMIALMINKLNEGMSPEVTLATFGKFKKDFIHEQLGLLHKFLDSKFEERMETFRSLLKQALYDQRIDEVFTLEGFRGLFCIMALNGQGIGTSSLEDFHRLLIKANPSEQTERALEIIEALETTIEEVSGEFTHAEGSGLYELHSKLNHSCRPNAEIRFPCNNSELQVVAIRPIAAGEEICISYIDLEQCCDEDHEMDDEEHEDNEDHDMDGHEEHDHDHESSGMPVSERQELLRNFYLFECDCSLCTEELLDNSPVGL